MLYYNTLVGDEIQHFSVGSAIHNSYLVFTWNPLSLCRTQNLRTVFTSIKKIDLTFLPLVMCLSELPSVLQNISEVSHNYSNTELREVLLSFCNVSNSAVPTFQHWWHDMSMIRNFWAGKNNKGELKTLKLHNGAKFLFSRPTVLAEGGVGGLKFVF